MSKVITTIQTMRTIYYAYGALCLIFIIYKTIDPRNKKPSSSTIGRFFTAVLMVSLVSILIYFLIGFMLPYIGLSIFF